MRWSNLRDRLALQNYERESSPEVRKLIGRLLTLCKRREVNDSHLLSLLLKENSISAAVSALGGSFERLTAYVAWLTEFDSAPGIHPVIQRIFAAAEQRVEARPAKTLHPLDLLVTIAGMQGLSSSSYLSEQGVTYLNLTYWLAHGRNDTHNHQPFEFLPVDGEEAVVVVMNDEFSIMDFVVNVFKLHFGIGDRDAIRLMLEVHSSGRAVCWRGASDDAVSKAVSANEFSRRAHQPLLFIVEMTGS